MKYLIIPSILVLTVAAQASVEPKRHGAYVGLGALYSKPNNKLTAVTTNSHLLGANTDSNNVKTSSKSTIAGRLLVGYHAKWHNDVFAQAELFGQLADPQQKTDTINGKNSLEELTIKLKRQWTTGMTFRVGYYFNEAVGAFLSAGPSYSQFKTTVGSVQGDKFSLTKSQTQKVWGANFGGGFIYNVTDSVLLKAEYSYERYKKFKTNTLQSYYAAGGNNTSNIVTSKVHYNTFMISASYLF